MRFKLSSKGFNLIKQFERLELKAYLDPAGIPTIGYGTTKLNGFSVALGMEINEPVADALLFGSVNDCIKDLDRLCEISRLNQNQVDALASLIYNIGGSNFATSSLLLSINKKLMINEDLFTRWNKAHVAGVLTELSGLTKRRQAEYELFIKEGI